MTDRLSLVDADELYRNDFSGSWHPQVDLRRPHLLLQLLSRLQTLVSLQQPQLLQLLALHPSRQEEVEREGHVFGEPAASHVHVVLWLDPEGVDLQEPDPTVTSRSSRREEEEASPEPAGVSPPSGR